VQSWRRETLSLARAREFLPRVAFGKEFKGQRWGADKSVWIARRLAHFGRQLFAERPLCANTGHSRTDKRLCEVLSVNDKLHFMCHERADNFLPRLFYFFLESIYQIRENEQKLGRMLFSQVTFCCGMTP
jgi:hypothetical protein